MESSCIKINQLTKRYPGETTDSLCGINLDIGVGDKFGILGPNGAGKTTLISILCGIIEPTAGEVSYWDVNATLNFEDVKLKLGYVPQEYAFYQELTPTQNLEYFGAMYKLSARQIAEKTNEILHVLGLENVRHKKLTAFSGGMKRRMNLAIGIIHDPTVLFLDEPTVGVDIQSKVAILRFLNALNAKGATIIYTSHHLDEAQEFCNKIALIDNGSIIANGEVKSLLTENKVRDLKELLIQLTGESFRD